jgi:hypothetical protein
MKMILLLLLILQNTQQFNQLSNHLTRIGHDYYGRSSSPGSLLIWTHSMRDLEFHDEFTPTECEAGHIHNKAGVPAVTTGAGITWIDVYLEATERNLVRRKVDK